MTPCCGEPAPLGDDVGGAAGEEGAAEHRDGAERAAAVAAGRDLERRPRAPVEAGADDPGTRGGRRARRRRRGRRARRRGPGSATDGGALLALDRRQRQQRAAVARGVALDVAAREDRLQVGAHVAVGVEAEHGVGLGQLVGELLAVALGEAADRDDLLRAAAVALEVGGLEQRVDGVLLGLLDEAARVDDGDVGLGRVVDETPSLRRAAVRPAPRSRPRCACTRG